MRPTRLQKKWGSAALALLCLATPTILPAQAAEFRFAAFGDLPYTDPERSAAPRWIKEIAATQPAFLIHVGDFKASREPCTDALFADRQALLDASPLPLIYTPGDNEWTDCDSLAAGGYDPSERLDALRTLFFARPESLGQKKIAVEQQPGAPENLRWIADQVVFVTLNLPAGNNAGIRPQRSAELLAREPKILAWIRDGFAAAHAGNARAVVIAFQADLNFRQLRNGIPNRGFGNTLETLQVESHRWKKQVLLIHGDSHAYRFDQPLPVKDGIEPLPNVWRLEVPGSPYLGWVEVIVATSPRPDTPPFKVKLHPLK